ncbi:MAG TPA: endonuclease Q family protein [bacterium]|nr:endonuclease Q family protein [bacterium]
MYIADFHIHSKYSKATSKNMVIEELTKWAKYKGINILGTGDITHFMWFYELKGKLKQTDRYGIYTFNGVDFILTGEVNNIFEQDDVIKKIHNIIFLPSFEVAEKFNRKIEKYGDLNADGRPILHLSCIDLLNIIKEINEDIFVVPAHIWTPHFSVFGANSGFNSIYDCFGRFTSEIFALETGLSSDPEMNWMVSPLDRFSLISNSDAHSPLKIGRESNVFKDKFNYFELIEILRNKDKDKFLMTIEYFPEEGKYHFDGHRNCNVCFSPEESAVNNNKCPVCGRNLTIGVMHRVYDLADRKRGERPKKYIDFKKLVPLIQIISNVYKKGEDSIEVRNHYIEIIKKTGSEFSVLIQIPENELLNTIDEKIAKGIISVREGNVKINPGYDGEFGKVEIPCESCSIEDQPTLF